ncbi:uncharacterized protein LOC114247585 [Bombyx mandarina]|uniref:Uncharacterized protein LOC114247585 n=1 Tax=Bombyx mandarina TaxID=7092 RepID=A0A6J2K5Z6_BOMMA|nr:uncharacterized protein LOC114247585 [Bombyx mandarina]
MNTIDLAASDSESTSSKSIDNNEQPKLDEKYHDNKMNAKDHNNECGNDVTPQLIDDSEVKLKERIAQCRDIIESLKLELKEEKEKQNALKVSPAHFESISNNSPTFSLTSNNQELDDLELSKSIYSTCIDNKMNYGVNINEYEKQLQRYQHTLKIAQTEKKNAIRKQMLTKAFKLKLLEVENQCNIELLRVKQSLQCLEPLQMIASKWKSSSNDLYDTNNFELLPRFPEFDPNSGCDFHSLKDDIANNFDSELFENGTHTLNRI